jgi:hypothetical protein
VQVLRLGYRPRVLELGGTPPGPPGGVVVLDVVLASLPTMLQGVRTTGSATPNTTCAPRGDRAGALALLDQSRAGLLSMVVAREANPARVTRIAFTRTMDPTGTRALDQRVRVDSAADQTVSFNAVRTGSEFVREGFRVISDGEQTLFAPDADVLLDDSFARGYCFRLAPSNASRPAEAGLAFTVADGRRGRVDIDGTLWVDTVRRALVNIEFRYRGLEEQAERLGAGGQISFVETPAGVTMIDRWWLRLVGGATAQEGAPQRMFTVTESGGELARAVWPDGSSWAAPLGTLQLTLVRADGTIAAGVGVGLRETPYRAISNSDGRVTFPELVPGPYHVFVVDPILAPLGIVLPVPMRYEARRATTRVQKVVIPTAETFMMEACGGVPRTRRSVCSSRAR